MKSGWANIAATLHILCITNAIWWSCKSKLWHCDFIELLAIRTGPLLTWYCLFLDTGSILKKKEDVVIQILEELSVSIDDTFL